MSAGSTPSTRRKRGWKAEGLALKKRREAMIAVIARRLGSESEASFSRGFSGARVCAEPLSEQS